MKNQALNVLAAAIIGIFLNANSAVAQKLPPSVTIGTNPAGTAGLGNAFAGILVNSGPTNVTIGGTTPAARNLISGNTFYGVSFGQAGGAGGAARITSFRAT